MDTQAYERVEPPRDDINALKGPAVLEFGAPWCGICLGAQGIINTVLARRPELRRLRIEDGPGKPLGRSFQVKLWPTLVFLQDGQEVSRVVRPGTPADISEAMAKLEQPA